MPIYEFYCSRCHMVFSFLSRSVNTEKVPPCPRCRKAKLSREISTFAVTGRSRSAADADDLPVDDATLERAMTSLAGEAEKINEDDPRQAAGLMRRFSDMTGMKFGDGMEEALARMEQGEDPDKIEQDMGELMDGEEPFSFADGAGGAGGPGRTGRGPGRDPTLYEL